jgi:peptide/nickel transport system substrate-binding protein
MDHHHASTIGAIVLACALLTVSACGGGSSSTGGSSSGLDDTSTPQPGGTLTYAIEAETPGGFCLAEAQLATGGMTVAAAVYDPLMAFDAELKPRPYLAESMDVSDDATTFTFTLREGTTFHDGTSVTAAAVKDNIDLWMGESEATQRFGRRPLLSPFIFADLDTVVAADDRTVVVTAKRPWPAFPDLLASGRFGIMAPAQYGDPECAEKLVGSGPFKLVKWARGQQMVLEKNPDYWRQDATGVQLPYLDELILKPVGGGQAGLAALESGSVDALQSSLQATNDALRSDPDAFRYLPEADGHREVGHALVNSSAAPLDDPDVRRHLAMALDAQMLTDIVSDGGFDVAKSPFDTNVLGYLEDPGGPDFDPEVATEFFDGRNVAVRLAYGTDATTKLVIESMQTQWEQAGVTVKVEEMDQATLISKAIGGDFDIILWRNHPGADPDTQTIWWKSGSPANFGRIDDPEIDRLLAAGRVEQDPAIRTEIYQDLNRTMVDKTYNFWIWYTAWAIGTSPQVHNLTGTTLPDGSEGAGMNWGWHHFTEAWMEQ